MPVTGKTATTFYLTEDFDVIVIDAASLRTNGTRICTDLKNIKPQIPIILIVPQHTMLNGNVDARSVLELPFTAQKLINRIKSFQPDVPKYLRIRRSHPVEPANQLHHL